MAEKRFLGSKGLNKQQLKHEFKSKQHQFDKKLRGYKRRHQRGLALQIESSQTHNPQTFWSLINKLGPQKVKKIPEEVFLDNGSLCFDIKTVLNKWETDFGDLFVSSEWDHSYFEMIMAQKNQMEMCLQFTFPNPYLNLILQTMKYKMLSIN